MAHLPRLSTKPILWREFFHSKNFSQIFTQKFYPFAKLNLGWKTVFPLSIQTHEELFEKILLKSYKNKTFLYSHFINIKKENWNIFNCISAGIKDLNTKQQQLK